METQVTLRIVLLEPLPGVDFALQKGRGSAYETVQKQRSEGHDLNFEFTVAVKPGRNSTTPDFGGPYVQGPPGQRFIYIDIGTSAGQTGSPWSRRLKVPLIGITPEMLDSPAILEARVPGTGRDGGPACATVKTPGWRLLRK